MHLSGLATSVLCAILPPSCALCRVPVGQVATLCPRCHGALRLIASPYCACCGTPFPHPMPPDSRCAPCLETPPAYHSARAVCLYDEASRPLVTRLKYRDATWFAPLLGRWMGRLDVPPCDVVLPIPLHRLRLFQRRFNQSALLARHVARQKALPYMPQWLARVRATTPQASLTKPEREKNVRDAFAVPERYAALLHGTRVLLVDDVITTGATVHHASLALLNAGVSEVHVLTFARRFTLDG